MLLAFISTCYSNSTNNELGDPIPQNIQSLISNLENGELPNDLEKLHLKGKKITIKRTEIKIEDTSDTEPHSSSSSKMEVQPKNNYTNKKGIILNINENTTPVTTNNDNKTTSSKFQSLNLPAKNGTTQLIDNPQIIQNSEKIPTHPVFPIENLVSFIRVLEEHLEQMPEDEQARNREFDLNTDKGKVHLQRISLNKNDINTLKQAAAANVAKQQATNQTKQHTAIAKPGNLLLNNRMKGLLASPFTDLYNRENLLENRLANKTKTDIAIQNADEIVAETNNKPVNNQTAAEKLKKGVISEKTIEDHEADSIIAQESNKVADKINDIVAEGNPQDTTPKTNQNEQKKTAEQPQINVQAAKQNLVKKINNPKTAVMTPSTLTKEGDKKTIDEAKAAPLTVNKRSNLLENLNSFNLRTSDMNPTRALFSAGKSSEFLSQLKSIFNKMSTGSALGGGFENNLYGDEDDGSDFVNNDSEGEDDDDDDDD